MIAPFWAIDSTSTAYAAIKYAKAIVMSLAAIPTYLLARMMLPKRTSVLVAVLAVFIPGMAYASSMIPEVIALPVVRALLLAGRPRDGDGPAARVRLGGPRRNPRAARPQPSSRPCRPRSCIAGAALWITGAARAHFRRDWTRGDTIGAVVLLVGALILFNRVVMQHFYVWQFSTEYWKGRMVDLGLAGGARVHRRHGDPAGDRRPRLAAHPRAADRPVYRAFVACFAASIFCLGLYTAVKAAYLSTIVATLTEERNLIYLSPLMLIGTALVFQSRRIDWWLVARGRRFVALPRAREAVPAALPVLRGARASRSSRSPTGTGAGTTGPAAALLGLLAVVGPAARARAGAAAVAAAAVVLLLAPGC